MNYGKKDQSDGDILKEALDYYAEIVDHESDQRTRMAEDLRFAAGEQWPPQLKRQRENDPNGSRPCLVMDRINQYTRQVINDGRQNKPSIKVRPVDSGADPEVAEILQGVVRHIEDVSRADIAYDTALDNAVKPGLGWFRILTRVVDEKTNAQEIEIKRVPNIFSVYADCDWSEPDGSDIMRLFVTEDVPRKKFEKDHPNADVKGWEESQNDPTWVSRDMVKIAEYYCVHETTENILILDNEEEMEEGKYWEIYAADAMRPQIVDTREKKTRTVKWYKLTCGEILDQTVIPSQWIPVIPVIGNEHWVDGKRLLTGMVHWGADAMRAYNYARSAFVESVALVPKSPYVAAAGQIEQYEDQWDAANVSNQAVLRYDPQEVGGTMVPPPQRQMPPQPSSGWMQEMSIAERDLQSTFGMYAASIGAEGQEKSGRAILARQKEGDTSTFHYIDNLSRSIRHAGRIIIDMIPKIYDTRRILRILGEDGEPAQATIDPAMRKPLAKVQDQTGKIRKIFNPTIGTYDVSVTVGPSYNTKRMEAADAMVEMTRGNAELFPLIGDLMIRAMDWPMADEIAKRLKAMLPEQIKQLEAQDGQDPAQAAVAQVTQQFQQEAQAFQQQAMQAITQLQEQLARAQAQAEDQSRKLAIDEYKAETERMAKLAPAFDAQQIQQLVIQTMQQLLTPPDASMDAAMPMAEMMHEQMMAPEMGEQIQPEAIPPLAG